MAGGWRILVVTAMMVFALVGCSRAEDRTEQRTCKAGNYERSYLLFIPDTVKPDQPTPLVVAFHGAGGKGQDMLCCRPWAKKHGWLLACPDGLEHGWHAGATDPAKADKSDSDFALVPALIDSVGANYKVDRSRVYACGFSNGGGMSVRLGVHSPELFAAIASVGHTLTKRTAAQFPPSRPLSVLIMIGSADYGLGDHGRALTGNSFPAEEAARRWAEFDGCGKPTVTERPGAGPGDPTTIRETRYTGGKEGTEVILYWLVGIGHTWLRANDTEQATAGAHKLDSGEVIFDFFAHHVR